MACNADRRRLADAWQVHQRQHLQIRTALFDEALDTFHYHGGVHMQRKSVISEGASHVTSKAQPYGVCPLLQALHQPVLNVQGMGKRSEGWNEHAQHTKTEHPTVRNS